MSTEWGIFNTEGLVEGQFYSEQAARARLDELASDEPDYMDDDPTVERVCPEHTEYPLDSCEDCDHEDEPEDDDNE